ncbi:fimbria/pilus outer membrane usher protein [Stenotrophomonas rhizophila]|uniref:fimbria/pilus outer membrane usher protein n=2 Tax=Stenotrophomonas TaxID=40323 RepID=UPI000456D528|nr:fimbria/pilus outer membrane usher protein [Stenotrophomonas rhizophila]AHY60317.1 usher protein [Stenotrophomonas rhizophila]
MHLSVSAPLRTLSAAIALVLTAPAWAAPAPAIEFSEGFLLGGDAIDMSRYANGNPLPAGDYAVEVNVNGQFLLARDISFVASSDPHIATACLPAELVGHLSLKPAYLDALAAQDATCMDLPALVEGATVAFDSSILQLDISVPQAAQAQHARGYVAPAQRDRGINAGFIDYSFNQHRSDGRDNRYLGLRAGLNLGAWRLRHRASVNQGERGTHHDVISSHLQRDLPDWNSQLLLGQGNTGGELFDSVAFTGVRMATDERMLPDSLRGYAPAVRGIAEGNAVVRIHQNGNIIHEANVAPGPFLIEDLYPTNFGGDLVVTVTEADGREQRFSVSFSAVPQALRVGSSRFSATAGVLRDAGGNVEPLRFAEGTYARGISNRLTLLGGAQAGEAYQSVLAGAAINTAIGAFGADVTHSRARLRGDDAVTGNSIRLNFQRYVAQTGTNVGLAAYRYSTRGYLTLNDAARAHDDAWGYSTRARQRYQVNFTQRLGARSSVYLSGGHVAYWDSTQRQNDFQLGFQSTLGRANYSLSAMRYRLGDGRQDTRYTFTFGVPLGRSPSAPRATTQVGHSGQGGKLQLGVAGALGESRALTYSATASRSAAESGSVDTYVAYQGGTVALNAGYSQAQRYRSLNLGAAGSVALHAGGINFGPAVGEGFVLVQAEGAEGAKVGYGDPIRVAGNGYALLPHVSPYRWNQIDLDPSGLPLEVELLQTSQRVAPTAGSIVRVAFTARRERTLFIDATDALGQPLPFAARVEGDDGRTMGAVGQGGVIQLRGAQDSGTLIVDPNGPHRCRLEYRSPEAPDAYGLSWTQAICQPQPRLSPGLRAALAVPEAGDRDVLSASADASQTGMTTPDVSHR